MNKEKINPAELTGQAQNTYSYSMSENAGETSQQPRGPEGGISSENTHDEVVLAREALRKLELQNPEDRDEVEGYQTYSHELAKRAGILGKAKYGAGDSEQTLNITGYIGFGKDGRDYV